ncbi:MAG: hypothetical protein QW622_03650 [Candidatus Pacearchaeota archaeon]
METKMKSEKQEKHKKPEKLEEVKKEAKEILDKFAAALAKVKESIPESFVERQQDRRGEGKEGEVDKKFYEIFFMNAPKKEEDFILAEKKKW